MLGTLLAATLALTGADPGPGKAQVNLSDAPTRRVARQEATAPLERVTHDKVTLRREGKPLEIAVDAETPVFIEGRVAHVDALRPGTDVRVSYDAVGTSPKANWIEVVPHVAQPAPFDWSYP